MEKLFITLALCFFVGVLNAQNKEFTCSHAKSKALTAKTPTLTNSQESETHKYDVQFYKLNLDMTNTSAFIRGDGTIQGKTVVATDSILFELFKTFTIDSIYVNQQKTPFTQTQSVIKVPLNLPADTPFELIVYYAGNPPTATTNPLGGSGLSNDTSPSFGAQVTWSLSEPFSAYEWFPVKQVLSDKADSCAVNITIDTTLKAGSNGFLDSIVNHGDGTATYHWFHRHPIAYYLISVAVSDYIEYNTYAFQGTPNEILIQNYIYPSALAYYQTDIDETGDFLELFSSLYGMYPFFNEKYGHCMAPIGGGMEHQTMTTQGSFSRALTSHELAHQWWGDYVTCQSWADIWLNEGFASYSEYLMLEHLFPTQAANDMDGRHTNIMSQPDGSVYVTDSTNSNAIFSSRLTYNKGAAIIHTLRYLIQDDSLFFKGLKTYLNTYKNSTATALDMKNVLENTTGLNLDDFFNQWFFGEGYPTYSVNYKKEGDNLILNIQHTTSSNKTTLFTNPLDLKISRNNAVDTIVRVPISSNNDSFVLPNFSNFKKIVRIDPDNWIINKAGFIKKDTTLQSSSLAATSLFAFKIYPVPVNDVLVIEGGNESVNTLEILDLKGILIETVTFAEKVKLPVHTYPNGSYLIRITNGANQAMYKFVKI